MPISDVFKKSEIWDVGYTVLVDTGCGGVPVDPLSYVHNKILLALKRNIVKKCFVLVIAGKKNTTEVLRKFVELAEKKGDYKKCVPSNSLVTSSTV